MFDESPQFMYGHLQPKDRNQTDLTFRSAQLAAWDRILSNEGSDEWRESLKALFPKPDFEESYQFSTLHKAVLGLNNRSIKSALDEDRAQINRVDCFGRTALMWAAWRCDSQAIQTLLPYKPDCSRPDHSGDTPLVYASMTGTSCLELLLKATAKADLQWRHKRVKNTLLHTAIANYTQMNTNIGFKKVKMLVEAGVDVNARNINGWTALILAIYPQKDFAKLVRYLIRHGANPRIYCKEGHNVISRVLGLPAYSAA